LKSDLIVNNPSAIGISLHNSNIIAVSADNKTRAICFTCLAPLSIFFSGSKHGESDCKLAEEQFCTKIMETESPLVHPASTKAIASVFEVQEAVASIFEVQEAVASVFEVQDINDNELNLWPECKDACFVGKKKNGCTHLCRNVQINKLGEYVLFPLQCWHHGYFNDKSNKIFITAQLFTKTYH
jgi:hypothetical protein